MKLKILWHTCCAAAVLIGCIGAVVQGEIESYSLMVQQSPTNAGVVSPGTGIHKIGVGSPVTLQAIAKPGYRFLYWLGDVSDSSTDQAVVVLDAPKIVVAVFGRLEYQLMAGGGGSAAEQSQAPESAILGDGSSMTSAAGKSAGGNVLTASVNYAGGGGAMGGGRPPGTSSKLRSIPVIINDGSGDPDKFPVAGGDPQVPEPATIALLGLGAVLFLRPRSRVR